MTTTMTRYVPALRYHWLTRLYDPIVRVMMKDERFKRRLVEEAATRPGQDVLDLGCGTATLTLMIKRATPGARVVGIDADPRILALAREKAADAGLELELIEAKIPELPFPAGSFDRVVSSLVFHHLVTAEKRAAFARSYELLRPGGELHLADFVRPSGWLRRGVFAVLRLFDGLAQTRDNVRGLLPAFMREAGFVDVRETHRHEVLFGTVVLYRAVKPA